MVTERDESLREGGTRVGRASVVIAISLAAVLVVVIWVVNATRNDSPVPAASSGPPGGASMIQAPADVAASEEPPYVSPDVLDAGTHTAGLPRILDLGADKCVPCKMMAPVLEELRETYAGQLDVDFVDVWKDPATGRQYKVKVIPTQIFFDERGNELFRHQGFMSREDILAKWAGLGYEFEG
jgi:thioredoxin 1